MEIRNLITFTKIVEFQSFSKAAKSLTYAQSTVNMQIQQLENELEVQLFDRINKKIVLTEKGEKLYNYAKVIINTSLRAKSAMKEQSVPNGQLRLGVVESLCTSIFPDIILKYRNDYPEVEIIVKIATTLELLEMLKTNKVDMILTLDYKIKNIKWMKAIE